MKKSKPIRAAFRSRAYGEALALDPGGGGVIARAILGTQPQPEAFGGFFDVPPSLQHVVEEDGIAVLSIQGPLEQHASWLWHSYDEILERSDEALADGESRCLALKIDSPGGVCAGNEEARKGLRALAKKHGKPIYAYAKEMACSAAYSLACAASEIWLPEAGQLGSVGVILCTVDESKRLEKEGVAVRYVTSGKRKADMHPGSPITSEVIEVAQKKVDHLAGLFFRSVARSRDMSPESVEALEAGVFCGFDAVQVGLADGVAGWPKFLGYIRSVNRATSYQLRATPSAASARQPDKGPQMKNRKRILKLTQAVEDAHSAVAKAQKVVAKAEGGSEKKKALAALETELTAKIHAATALASAHAAPRSKTVTEKHSKVTEDADEEDDADAESEEEDEEDDEESTDGGEESTDGGTGTESTDGSSMSSTGSEKDDEEEKAIAKAFSAKASGEGLYTPYRLARVVKEATGCKTIKEAFGALAAMGPRLRAVEKTEARVAKLEGESRRSKVNAILETAKLDGRVVGKAHRDALRADGMQHGAKWLKAHVAVLPKSHKPLAEGGFIPRADTDGNVIGAPGSDAQKMDAAATAGMSDTEAKLYRELVAAKLKQNAAGHNPSH